MVNKIFHHLDAIGKKNGIWAITKEIKIGQKKKKKKTCEPNEQQNEQLEKLLRSMFKHNSLKLGLQLLFLGWMTTFTMIFKWVSKNIRIDTWGSI